jgi:outer membrane receptor protein involved in Fe transport
MPKHPERLRAVVRKIHVTSTHHQTLKLCSLALAVSLTTSIYAQESSTGLEEIRVTGTRIQRQTGMETPTPVTAVDISELEVMAPGQLVDSLSQLPQFFNNQRPQTTGFPSSGGSNVNLRGAGSSRTLVLLNGRRVPNANRFGAANVSAFPEGAISSIETVTGGASAAYGSDAIAGVVNFIMNTDFEGFSGHAQAGTTSRQDGDNFELSGTYGMDVGERGHILLSGDMFQQDEIISLQSLQDRDWFTQRALVTNPAWLSTDPPGTNPQFLTRDYVSQTNSSVGGIINLPGSALNKLEFIDNGGSVSTQRLAFSGVGALDGGCACQAEPQRDQSWGMDADNAIQNENSRESLFFYGDFDVTDNFNVFTQVMYGYAEVKGPWFSRPILTGPWQATIFSGNPFLPANVQATLDAEGRDSFPMGMTGDNSWHSLGPMPTYTIANEDEMLTGTVGFNTSFTDAGYFTDWNLSAYYQYGKNDQVQRFENGLRMGRLPVAMDVVSDPATGTPVCRAALINPTEFGDCVPVNLFGGVQNVSAQAASYLIDPEALILTKSEQTFAEIVLDGKLHDGWGAGPILGAFGASYREDTVFQKKDDLEDEFVFLNGVNTGFRGLVPENVTPGGMLGVRAGSVPGGFQGAANLAQVLFTGSYQTADTVLAGEFSVEEAFAEINVPLITNKPFFQELVSNLSYRYADYTGSGGIDSWKYGLSWSINDDIRLRFTRSRDVRAANLRERFDATAGGAQVRDPMFNNATIGTASRSGGNPNVNPEEADTITVGAVYQPTWLEGFSMSVDWYEIDLKGALFQPAPQVVVDGCFAGDQTYCPYVLRDPVNNQILRVDSVFINAANQILEGVDVEMRYGREVDFIDGLDENLTWRLFSTQVYENSIKNPNAQREFFDREQPDLRITTNLTYSIGPVRAFINARYMNGALLNRNWIEGTNVDDNSIPSNFVTDLNLSYDFDSGDVSWSIYGNITNLFDRAPPQTPTNPNFTGGTNGPNAALYDTIGRRWVVGVSARF